jgi:small subunit ribosomal protein S1
MSWTKRVQHPSEVVKKGDTVNVIILNIDADNKRISLGLKQATDDPWLTIGETLPIDSERRAKVLRPVDKGIVVDLGDDIEGFAPVSQMGLAPDQNPEEAVVEGQEVIARIIEVDPIHHRVVVAIIDYPADGIPSPEQVAAARAAAEARAAAIKAAESEGDDDAEG